MDYVLYISTPKNTLISAPKITTLRLSWGRLTGGFLFYPRGPSGYLHFLARIGVHQIVPFNIDQSYRLNGCVVPLHLDIDLFEPPYHIDCVTWNDSTEFAHALTVGFFLDAYAKPRIKPGLLSSVLNAVSGYKTGGDRKV